MKVCIIAPAKSGSTAIYNSVRSSLSRHGHCHAFFEPQRPYPLLRLKNYDFAENFVTKIMVSRMLLEKSDFHMDWFDKRIIVVRDVKDLIISQLLFRPMIAPLNVSPEAMTEFLALIKDKEINPQSISVFELHKRATELGISTLNWEIFRKHLNHLKVLQERHDCTLTYFEDYARGDYSNLRSVLSMPVGPANLDDTWVSHIQRKGKSGEWRDWFTPSDMEFVHDFFAEYNSAFGYDTPLKHEYNTAPIDPQSGSEYIKRKYLARCEQVKMLNQENAGPETIEDIKIFISRARDGGVQQIERLLQLASARSLPTGVISSQELRELKFFKDVIS